MTLDEINSAISQIAAEIDRKKEELKPLLEMRPALEHDAVIARGDLTRIVGPESVESAEMVGQQ